MARKRKHEEHENHERWLVSYADFITLLFAFFVVMYAISSVNEGKYRVLSSALVSAFSHPQKTIEPIQYGTPLRSPIIQHESLFKDSQLKNESTIDSPGVDHRIVPTPKEMADMQKLADEIEYNLKPLIDQELITVTKTNQGLEIEIKSNILFASGAAVLSLQAIAPLKKIAAVLAKVPNDINVEGYTDNVPISTASFPSNWELSAARAASVVRLFTQSGLQAMRLKAIGFGEHQPIADNATELGRSKNRRVAIMVLNRPEEKRSSVGINKKAKAPTAIGKETDSKPAVLPPVSASTGTTDAGKSGAPIQLPAPANKPAITTLPPAGNKPRILPSAPSKPGDNSNEPPAAAVKTIEPIEPINLPVLQSAPQNAGGRP